METSLPKFSRAAQKILVAQNLGGCSPPRPPGPYAYDDSRKKRRVLLLSSSRAVQAMACANHFLQSCFSQKEFLGELIFFRHLSMDYITF